MSSKKSIHDDVRFKFRCVEGFCYLFLHFFPNSRALREMREKNTRECAKELSEKNKVREILEIDRVDTISRDEFIKKYYSKDEPVIITGGIKDWPCFERWNLDYLEEQCPNVKLDVLDSEGITEKAYKEGDKFDKPRVLKTLSPKELKKHIESGDKKYYVQFSQMMDEDKTLLKDINVPWLKNMGRSFLGTGYQTFIGPEGRRTPIHSSLDCFFYMMVRGEKRWSLFSSKSSALIQPEVNKRVYLFSHAEIDETDELYPGFEYLTRYEFVLKEGDMLFVPSWMYHEVRNLSDSWGINYRFNALYPMVK